MEFKRTEAVLGDRPHNTIRRDGVITYKSKRLLIGVNQP